MRDEGLGTGNCGLGCGVEGLGTARARGGTRLEGQDSIVQLEISLNPHNLNPHSLNPHSPTRDDKARVADLEMSLNPPA